MQSLKQFIIPQLPDLLAIFLVILVTSILVNGHGVEN